MCRPSRSVLSVVLVVTLLTGAGVVGPPAAADVQDGLTDQATVTTMAASPPPNARVSPEMTASRESETPAIRAVYSDPVADGDRGEFVLLAPRGGNLSRYNLTDGERTISLPPVDGPVAVTAAPGRVHNVTGHAVHRAALSLSNGGETVRLVRRRDGRVVSVARYEDAEEGAIYTRQNDSWGWQPLGATDRPVVSGTAAPATAFVLPDAPMMPVRPLRRAQRRILLAGYTLGSERVVDALIAAHDRGVTVRILLEGGPIEGPSRRQARLLDRLVAAGIEVRVLGGPHDRYAYHHAKYAVVDDRAVVLTENWKPAGTGGASSRGWGTVVRDPELAAGLAATFRADAGWIDARSWTRFRRGRAFTAGGVANGTYPQGHSPVNLTVDRWRLLVTPDNARPELIDALDGATASIRVIQVGLGGPETPLVRALLRAARRGVTVRVLLSSAWYVREDNRALADRLTQLADRADLPLTVRLARPDGYRKIHAKGAIIDGRTVALGSLNWNPTAATENREVVLLLEGDRIGSYYATVFDDDWRGGAAGIGVGIGTGSVPPIALGAAGCAVIVALAMLRRIDIDERASRSVSGQRSGATDRPPGTAPAEPFVTDGGGPPARSDGGDAASSDTDSAFVFGEDRETTDTAGDTTGTRLDDRNRGPDTTRT